MYTKTHVTLIQEMCTAFNLGAPCYTLENEPVASCSKVFRIRLSIGNLELTGVGVSSTKMQAKHKAANDMMQQIRNASIARTSLKDTPLECINQYSNWLKQYQIDDEGSKSVGLKNWTGLLIEWALSRDLALPEYETVSFNEAAPSKIFVLKCKFQTHITHGEGKTKQLAKHIAAEKMLQIVQSDEKKGFGGKDTSPSNVMMNPATTNWTQQLNEWVSSRDLPLPDYEMLTASGPAHNRTFTMACKLKNHQTRGEGKTKQIAKHLAAYEMLAIVKTEENQKLRGKQIFLSHQPVILFT